MTMAKVGVVGCGDVASGIYLPGLKELQDEGLLEVTAACDLDEERAKGAARRYGIPRCFTDYEEMLRQDDVEIIVNLTNTQAHASCTLAALKAGKHVYSEKPLATTLEEGREIVTTAESCGLKVACAPTLLLHPELVQVTEYVRSGTVGKVCFIRARASNPGPAWITDFRTDPTWFYKKGGGPVFDLAVYPLQVIVGLLGPAKRVVAFGGIAVPQREVRFGPHRGKVISVEVEDNVHLMLDFGGATFAYVDATYCVLSSRGPRMEVYGTKGAINLYSRPGEPAMEILRDEEETGIRGWLQPESAYRGALSPVLSRPLPRRWTYAEGVLHLARCVSEGRKPLIDAQLGLHILEIMLRAADSVREGCAVALTTGL